MAVTFPPEHPKRKNRPSRVRPPPVFNGSRDPRKDAEKVAATRGARLALFRVVLYLWAALEFSRMRTHGTLDLPGPHSAGIDRAFRYPLLAWLQSYAPTTDEAAAANHLRGVELGALCAAGVAFPVTAPLFAVLFARQFFLTAATFTDAGYLFCLLLFLAALSGAADDWSVDDWTGRTFPALKIPKASDARKIWVLRAIRGQFLVFYGWGCLWKLHGDFLSGRIDAHMWPKMAEHFLVPWTKGPYWIYSALAHVSCLLDFCMCLSILGVVPEEWRVDMVARGFFRNEAYYRWSYIDSREARHALFYVFFELTSAVDPRRGEWIVSRFRHRVLFIGEIALAPLHGEARLKVRVEDAEGEARTFAARGEPPFYQQLAGGPAGGWRAFAMCYLAWQALVPLRAVGSTFPYDGRGARFSWKQAFHDRTSTWSPWPAPNHDPYRVQFFGLVPYCATPTGQQFAVPRKAYWAGSERGTEDERTLPMNAILGRKPHHQAMLNLYPHLLAPVADAVAGLVQERSNPCAGRRLPEQLHVSGSLFVAVNGRKDFARVVDPTVDLAAAGRAPQSLWQRLTDEFPREHEFLLRDVGASLTAARAAELRGNHTRVAVIADRAPCLARRDLWLRPGRTKALEIRSAATNVHNMVVRRCDLYEANSTLDEASCRDKTLLPGGKQMVAHDHVELILIGARPKATCRDSPEDVHVAVAWIGTDHSRTSIHKPPPPSLRPKGQRG